MRKPHLFFLIFFLTFILNATAQEESNKVVTIDEYKTSYKKTFFTGGNLGLQFGTVTMVDVSPQVGYYIFENISAGVGFTYQYISDRRYLPTATMHVLGGRVFTRLHLPFFNSIFGQAEYEFLAYKTNVFSSTLMPEWIKLSNILAGIGYRQKIYNRSSITLMVLWNFNQTEYNLYSNPVIRAGFDIGL